MLGSQEAAWQAAENGIVPPAIGVPRKGALTQRSGAALQPSRSGRSGGTKHRSAAAVAADGTSAAGPPAALLDTLERARIDAAAAAPRGSTRSGARATERDGRLARSASGGGLPDDRDKRAAHRDSHSGPQPRAGGGGGGHNSHSAPQPQPRAASGHSGPQPREDAAPAGRGHRHSGHDAAVGTTLGLDMKALAQMERAVGLTGHHAGAVPAERMSGGGHAAPGSGSGRDQRRPPSGGTRSSHAKVMMWDDSAQAQDLASSLPVPPLGRAGTDPPPLGHASGTLAGEPASASATGGLRTTDSSHLAGASGEEAGRTSRSHSSRMRAAPLTAENLLLLEPRRERRQDPRERLLRWLDALELPESSGSELRSSAAEAAAAAAAATSTGSRSPAGGGGAIRRTTSGGRRHERQPGERHRGDGGGGRGFVLSSLFSCFSSPKTRR